MLYWLALLSHALLVGSVSVPIGSLSPPNTSPTTKPPSTTQGPIWTFLPHCWTDWFDRDDPTDTGDWETLYDLKKDYPGKICDKPLKMTVLTTGGAPAASTGDVFFYFDVVNGFACRNQDQGKRCTCKDYKVRFLCPASFCYTYYTDPLPTLPPIKYPEPTEKTPFTKQSPVTSPLETDCWTQWFDRDDPRTEGGDYETLSLLRQENPGKICSNPLGIQALTVAGLPVSDIINTYDVVTGFICINLDQRPKRRCSDYKVRFKCPPKFCKHHPTQHSHSASSSEEIWPTLNTKPTLATRPVETAQHSHSASSSEEIWPTLNTKPTLATRPVETVYTHPLPIIKTLPTIKFPEPTEKTPFTKQTLATRPLETDCWTQWFDRDDPWTEGGDFETLSLLRQENPGKICSNPLGIQALTVAGLPVSDIINTYDVVTGFICINLDQRPKGWCSDYKVRFKCPPKFCKHHPTKDPFPFTETRPTFLTEPAPTNWPHHIDCWTQWFDRDDPWTEGGDYETLSLLRQENPGKICSNPLGIQALTVAGLPVSDIINTYDVVTGFICINLDQRPKRRCSDYKVRFKCPPKFCKHHPTQHSHSASSSEEIWPTLNTKPTLATRPVETAQHSHSASSSEEIWPTLNTKPTLATRPVETVYTHPLPIIKTLPTIKFPEPTEKTPFTKQTLATRPLETDCWTQWFDRDDPWTEGGDYETLSLLRQENPGKICSNPLGIQALTVAGLPVSDIINTYDVVTGFICINLDQRPKRRCSDYKVRFKCPPKFCKHHPTKDPFPFTETRPTQKNTFDPITIDFIPFTTEPAPPTWPHHIDCWTQWFDRDDPWTEGGDYETLSLLRQENPGKICSNPLGIQALTVAGLPVSDIINTYDVVTGFICINLDQRPKRRCSDYKVRFKCPPKFCKHHPTQHSHSASSSEEIWPTLNTKPTLATRPVETAQHSSSSEEIWPTLNTKPTLATRPVETAQHSHSASSSEEIWPTLNTKPTLATRPVETDCWTQWFDRDDPWTEGGDYETLSLLRQENPGKICSNPLGIQALTVAGLPVSDIINTYDVVTGFICINLDQRPKRRCSDYKVRFKCPPKFCKHHPTQHSHSASSSEEIWPTLNTKPTLATRPVETAQHSSSSEEIWPTLNTKPTLATRPVETDCWTQWFDRDDPWTEGGDYETLSLLRQENPGKICSNPLGIQALTVAGLPVSDIINTYDVVTGFICINLDQRPKRRCSDYKVRFKCPPKFCKHHPTKDPFPFTETRPTQKNTFDPITIDFIPFTTEPAPPTWPHHIDCWTQWFDRDDPWTEGGDYETLSLLRQENPGKICSNPLGIQALTVAGLPVSDIINTYDVVTGFICINLDQRPKRRCSDYKVRFKCPPKFCKHHPTQHSHSASSSEEIWPTLNTKPTLATRPVETDCWTQWFDRDDPRTEGGDYETLSLLRQENPGKICSNPLGIQALTVAGLPVSDIINTYDVVTGFICINLDQRPKGWCSDYKVRFKCPPKFCKHHPTKDPFPFTETRPTFLTEPAPTNWPHHIDCWTQWFDRDDPWTDNGDFETLSLLHQENPGKICSNPLGIQALTIAGLPVSTTGDIINTYDVVTGFICINLDQRPKRRCSDYKVRFKCPPKFCKHHPTKDPFPTETLPTEKTTFEPITVDLTPSRGTEPETWTTFFTNRTRTPPPPTRPSHTKTPKSTYQSIQTLPTFITRPTPFTRPFETIQITKFPPTEKTRPTRPTRPFETIDHFTITKFPPTEKTRPTLPTRPVDTKTPKTGQTFITRPTRPTRPFETNCWTKWFDRDDPSGSGDWETLPALRSDYPNQICDTPLQIQAKTTTGLSVWAAGNVLAAYDTTAGLICKNLDQRKGVKCNDFQVRFLCPPDFCRPRGCYTEWFDRDDPSATGDWETLYALRAEYPGHICNNPLQIQVETLDGKSIAQTGNIITAADVTTGFICKNSDQPSGTCEDFRVRFWCPLDFCQQRVCWTRWFDRDDPSGSGDWELLSDLKKEYPHTICDTPLYIDVRTVDTNAPITTTGQTFHIYSPTQGFACRNQDQKGCECRDYKVRFGCPCKCTVDTD